ncbi:hypothetical protein MFLAVUS_008285 [Mucor flavus]|uniref:Uncharacterized protein n=1 Tax=Mucor flavus TaxID=439312 RepID=A0ABP9Z6M9_9FUNG
MSKQIVLITGCSRGGIGYAMSDKFLKEGHTVIATSLEIESLESLAEVYDRCERELIDINDEESISATVEKVINKFGRIDILINNAGLPAVGALLDIDLETAQRCVNTNVFGTLKVSRIVGLHMAKRGKGKIVNIGSVTGYASTPWAGIYALSKAAMHSMSDTLRMELKPFGIQVVIVAPGATKSNLATAGAKLVHVPEGNSLYISVSKYIIGRASASHAPGSTSADEFAAYAVKKILEPVSPRYVTFGQSSRLFFVMYYLPVFIRDFILSKTFGVGMVRNQN